MTTILYIDGENLKHYLKSALTQSGVKEDKLTLENYDYDTYRYIYSIFFL